MTKHKPYTLFISKQLLLLCHIINSILRIQYGRTKGEQVIVVDCKVRYLVYNVPVGMVHRATTS